ncbi:MAG: hypothetical protein COC19_07125 [SAR86 cluster bacterium]|uniref:Uncharacterized protein n=1 Tax=SAR86 cluster bacterium TaxID=2030880 RepID=A0A2A4MIG8_9GAMM|nr:MAG: hypothetical protein COC19_07125 [SAR86 cluster bacterium]
MLLIENHTSKTIKAITWISLAFFSSIISQVAVSTTPAKPSDVPPLQDVSFFDPYRYYFLDTESIFEPCIYFEDTAYAGYFDLQQRPEGVFLIPVLFNSIVPSADADCSQITVGLANTNSYGSIHYSLSNIPVVVSEVVEMDMVVIKDSGIRFDLLSSSQSVENPEFKIDAVYEIYNHEELFINSYVRHKTTFFEIPGNFPFPVLEDGFVGEVEFSKDFLGLVSFDAESQTVLIELDVSNEAGTYTLTTDLLDPNNGIIHLRIITPIRLDSISF